MNRKIIAISIATSVIFSTLFGCVANNQNTATKITAETPYYYVTNGAIIKERNHYMEVEAKMPRIKYYNEETDPVFDPINNEIESTITKIVNESKKNAYDTYMAYLDSAKENVENEKAKRIKELKDKYKSILTDDEVKAIRELEDEDIFYIATESFLTVDGFTSTEDILNEGPHNKKIIVIDNTSKDTPTNEVEIKETLVKVPEDQKIKQATIKIEGKPGNKIVESSENLVAESTKKTVAKKENIVKAEVKATKSNTKKESKAEKDTMKKMPMKGFNKNFASRSNAFFDEEITDEITLDNFYKELRKIKRLRVPNKMALTFEYLPTYIYCDFDVKCLDEDYISLYIYFYETRTQTASKVLFYNIDLKNKKLLTIKDVLGDEFKDICIKSINSTIENWTEDKKSLLTSKYNVEDFINEDTTFFINNNHIPVVVFDKYVVTAGAAGYPEFQIIK